MRQEERTGATGAATARGTALPAAHERHVERVCPTCGSTVEGEAIRRRIVKRGALVMRSNPVEFEWKDHFLPLAGLELTLFAAVMVRGRASWEELDRVLQLGVSTKRALLHRLRAKFKKIGAVDPLETIPGWGLKLVVEPDVNGSCSTWIGADDDSERMVHRAVGKPAWPRISRDGLEWAGLVARPGRQNGRRS